MRVIVLAAITLVSACTSSVTEREVKERVAAFTGRCEQQLASASEIKRELESLEAPYTIGRVLKPFNRLEMLAGDLYSEAQLYEAVHPDQAQQLAASACKQKVAEFISALPLSQGLYRAISAVELKNANAETRRYVELTLKEFRRSGVDRPSAVRARVQSLSSDIETLEQEYQRNLREDVRYIALENRGDLTGLPADYINSHPADADGFIRISTRYPDYLPFMTYAKQDEHRRRMATVFQNRAWPQNQLVLERLLRKRYELAQLLGYSNFAGYVTDGKMSGSAERVQRFIDELANLAQPVAEREYDELLALLQQRQPNANRVEPWQKSYLSEQLKRQRYAFDSVEVREYFGYRATRDGVFQLVDQLFGLTIRPWKAEVWHPSVEAYEMLDGQQVIGRFYLDMHPREGKYTHAAHFPLKSGVAGRQIPVSVLVANMPGVDDPDARLLHDDVETFVHEFGHLLHRQLSGQYEWAALTGTEWDFVEAPAMLLEQWVWHPNFLRQFARNRQGEVIPDGLIEKMNQARRFGQGLFVQSQLYYAAVSLNYHNYNPEQVNLYTMMRDLSEQYTLFSTIPDSHFYASFGHLAGGYSAIYHTYMWSLAIALDMFSEFEREGLFDSQVANRYREAVLGAGGSEPAEALIEAFLQRPFNLEAFSRYLGVDMIEEGATE